MISLASSRVSSQCKLKHSSRTEVAAERLGDLDRQGFAGEHVDSGERAEAQCRRYNYTLHISSESEEKPDEGKAEATPETFAKRPANQETAGPIP